MSKPIIVVGGGISGLICARTLHRNGHSVLILEADERLGGRHKTDSQDGFRFDRELSVLYTAFSETAKDIDLDALDLRSFDAGVLVRYQNKLRRVVRDDFIEMAFSRFFSWSDKLKAASWSSELRDRSLKDISEMPECDAEAYLRRYGFSDDFLEKFARPFFGNLFWDRALSASCRKLAFVWKMLNEGEAAIPSHGIEQLPKQIAADVPADRIRCGSKVMEIGGQDGRNPSVKLGNGETLEAEAVAIATDAREAARLLGSPAPTAARSSTCLYFQCETKPIYGGLVVLNGDGAGLVSSIVPVSNVSSSCSPSGKHLVAVLVLGEDSMTGERLAREVQYELADWFAGRQSLNWKFLRSYTALRYAGSKSPSHERSSEGNVFVCKDFSELTDIEGSVRSGRDCAMRVEQGISVGR